MRPWIATREALNCWTKNSQSMRGRWPTNMLWVSNSNFPTALGRHRLPKLAGDSARLQQLATDHPQNFAIGMQVARELMQSQDWQVAKVVLESLCELHGLNPTAYRLLARIGERSQDVELETSSLQRVLELDADDFQSSMRMAELAWQGEQWGASAAYAQRALAVNPLLPAAQEMLAGAAEKINEPALAVAGLSALIEMGPLDPAEVNYRMARNLHKLGRFGESRRYVLQALEFAPRYKDALKLLVLLQDETQVDF